MSQVCDPQPPAPVRGERDPLALVPRWLRDAPLDGPLRALGTAWALRDRLGLARRVLAHGVCDQCALGPRGLRDDARPGLHLCQRRLDGLADVTAPPVEPARLDDLAWLARHDDAELRRFGRLDRPYLHCAGARGLQPLGWDEARDALRDALPAPGRAAWLADGRPQTVEGLHAFARAARAAGAEVVASTQQLRGTGLSAVLGAPLSTLTLGDLVGTDLLVLWGADALRSHPMLRTHLADAKARGTRVVCVDSAFPDTLGPSLVDELISITPDGTGPLLRLVLLRLKQQGAIDRAWLRAHAEGWEALAGTLDQLDPRVTRDRAGVHEGQLTRLVELIARARTLVSVWAAGPAGEDHPAPIEALFAALHAARGALGRPLCGLLPLPEEGALASWLVGLEPVDLATLQSEATAGALGSLVTSGDRIPLDADALQRIPVRVHLTTHLHPAHLQPTDGLVLLLPSQTRYDQRGGGVTLSAERRLRLSPEVPDHPVLPSTRPGWALPGWLLHAAAPQAAAPDFRTSEAARQDLASTRDLPHLTRLALEGDHVLLGGPLRGGAAEPDRRAQLGAVR